MTWIFPASATTAMWSRARGNGVASLHVPVAGSKTSCVATVTASSPRPPMTWIFPASTATPTAARGAFMGASVRQRSLAGSYSNTTSPAPWCTDEVKPHARCPHHFGPFWNLGLHVRAKFLGRARARCSRRALSSSSPMSQDGRSRMVRFRQRYVVPVRHRDLPTGRARPQSLERNHVAVVAVRTAPNLQAQIREHDGLLVGDAEHVKIFDRGQRAVVIDRVRHSGSVNMSP